MSDTLIHWSKHYRPLPHGYAVYWVECVEHYMGFGPEDAESRIFSSRYDARRWCFAHAYKQRSRP